MEGSTDESYGIYVAKLAGINEKIIKRAEEILNILETEDKIKSQMIEKSEIISPSLFENIDLYRDIKKQEESDLKKEIKNIDINNITPLQAFLKLKELKEKIENGKD